MRNQSQRLSAQLHQQYYSCMTRFPDKTYTQCARVMRANNQPCKIQNAGLGPQQVPETQLA
jgi:hypothetical protein